MLDGVMPGQEAEKNGVSELINLALGLLRRQYWVIIAVTALAWTASAVYVKTVTPTYTAQVKLLFGNQKTQFTAQQAETPLDTAQFESQIQILKSRAIASSVIEELKLSDDPDLKGSKGFLHSASSTVREWLGTLPPEDPADPTDRLIAEFDSRLSATRLGFSTVIEISYSASKPDRAAEIANAVAAAYIADQFKAKADANRTATTWLRDRLKELGHDAITAERAVNALKAQNNIVAADGKLMDEQQVAELNSRLVAVRGQTTEASARLHRLETILSQNSADSTQLGSLDAPGSEALSNPIINSLRQQYLEYARREYEWSTRYGKDHTAVANLRTAMRAIRASILDEVRRLAETSKSDLEVARQRQQEIEKQLALAVSQSRTTNSAELSIRELETNAKGYRSLYESFLQRYMGSVQQESFPIAETRVISPATAQQSKGKPRGGLIMTLATLAGIALGTALGFLRDTMERVFRTPAQVEATLRLPCLSVVPLMKHPENPQFSPRTALPTGEHSNPRQLSRTSGMYWAAATMPTSRFAESIRAIRLAIDLDPTKTSNKVIGITSALPNEGKSTIAASLAHMIARAGKQVIMVDCDLRNPSLSANLAPNVSAGIVEVLSDALPLEEAVWKDPQLDLTFLPAKKAPHSHTSEILSGDKTKVLFDKLRATYDCVVVDLPPLAPIVDVRATTPLIDCFILVVEWGQTATDVVQHALHTAPNVYDAVAGAVLNKTDITALKRYDSYGGDYYNNEYYARYGQLPAE